ncbi:energy transducer TonB [Longibacter salinarum]|uniref:energy transducer TonB n=1 Tax=Longibacter salinarum TaxID=1850348 RepID=UPI0015CF6F0A|nr:energy transducer TonB [Longibacter salinarum]
MLLLGGYGAEDSLGQADPVSPERDTVVVADRPPRMIGGMKALRAQVNYPDSARRQGIEGRVFVQFIVTTEGKPVDIKVVRGLHGALDQAAINAVGKMKFDPGLLNGEPTNVVMSLPVTFELDR